MSSAMRKRTFLAFFGHRLTAFGGIIGGDLWRTPDMHCPPRGGLRKTVTSSSSNWVQVNAPLACNTVQPRQWAWPPGEESLSHWLQHCAEASAMVGPGTLPELYADVCSHVFWKHFPGIMSPLHVEGFAATIAAMNTVHRPTHRPNLEKLHIVNGKKTNHTF